MEYSIRAELECRTIDSKRDLENVIDAIKAVLQKNCTAVEVSIRVQSESGNFSGDEDEFRNEWSPLARFKDFHILFMLCALSEYRPGDPAVHVYPLKDSTLGVGVSANKQVLSETILIQVLDCLKRLQGDPPKVLVEAGKEQEMQKVMVYTPEEDKADSNRKFTRQQIVTIIAAAVGGIVGSVATYLLTR